MIYEFKNARYFIIWGKTNVHNLILLSLQLDFI